MPPFLPKQFYRYNLNHFNSVETISSMKTISTLRGKTLEYILINNLEDGKQISGYLRLAVVGEVSTRGFI